MMYLLSNLDENHQPSNKWNGFETFLIFQTLSISVELDWRGQERIRPEKQRWLLLFMLSKCVAWENVLGHSYPRWNTTEACINLWVSAVHFPALTKVLCVISAHLGFKEVCGSLRRARSSEFSSFLAQTVGLFWSTELVYVVVSEWIYSEDVTGLI